jgi:hypothetical protein
MDNADPFLDQMALDHLKKFNLQRALHPAFSPGPAPSDFAPFGVFKRKIPGLEFGSLQELVSEVTDITSANAFGEWE